MSFYTTREVKACRKTHRCYWCGQHIEKGQPMTTISSIWEGDFSYTKLHPECHVALSLWQKEVPYDEEWPEEGTMQRGSTEER